MESIRTFRTRLALMALMVTTAVIIGLLFLAPTLRTPDLPVPAPKAQATEQEMEQAWENLVDAIRREDQVEALRIAERLDELQKMRETEISVANLRIVQSWCEMGGYKWDFCKEEDSAK